MLSDEDLYKRVKKPRWKVYKVFSSVDYGQDAQFMARAVVHSLCQVRNYSDGYLTRTVKRVVKVMKCEFEIWCVLLAEKE